MTHHLKSLSALTFLSAVLALPALSSAAAAAECFDEETSNPKAGNATAVVGPDVGLMQDGGDYARPSAGDDVFSEDHVRTGAASHMQLKLCDWSTYTFPPESEAQISEFYDDEGARRRRVVNYVRGGLRYSSGRDTEAGSTEVEIQDSAVTMGVRGTNVILVELDGEIYALLEGPALDNTGYAPQGRVEFWTGENRAAIEARLMRPGWVVRIGADGVSDPYRADTGLLNRIYSAFLPAIPDESGDYAGYTDSPEGDSGQGAQQGQEGVAAAGIHNEQEDEDTENLPEQPSEAGITVEDRYNEAFPSEQTPPFPVNVGDILPLDALEYYAAAQMAPSGHILAVAPAQLFVDSGSGPAHVDDGVVLIQINFDIASRTIAPEALASFMKFDFSVSGPADLGANDTDWSLDDQFKSAFAQALLASSPIAFGSGQGDVAVFPAQAFTVTVRQGAGDTVTVDVASDFSATNGQLLALNAIAEAPGLQLAPGEGGLVYFAFDLSDVHTIASLADHSTSGATKLYGITSDLGQTQGQAGPLTGLAYAQIEVNFSNHTIGGPGSFMVMTAAASAATGGQQANAFIPLNQVAPFGAGLFDMAIYPISLLTDSSAALAGQALVASPGENGLGVDIAAILEADTGAHLYSETFAENQFSAGAFAPTSIAALDALGAAPGAGSFFFDGSGSSANVAFLSNPAAGDAFGSMNAQVDISFANRTLGGGDSFVSIDLSNIGAAATFQFTEFLNEASFDSALGGVGVFAFDDADFSGDKIQSLIFIIRNDPAGAAAQSADAFVNFTDGEGGKGLGELRDMLLSAGAVCTPSCSH